MTFRSKLARFGQYDQVMPVVLNMTALQPTIPVPIYPPIPPKVFPIKIGEYPPKERALPGDILANNTGYMPSGYLLCNGSEVSRTTYEVLYKIIGTYYGDGDLLTTFNLPNLTNASAPNVTYIIKYDLFSDTTMNTNTNGGTNTLQNVTVQANVQILPYPLPYVPVAGTILNNTTTSVPYGYLACDGSPVSRATYNVLFAMIGTFYGSGDGLITFNLPNLSLSTANMYTYIIRYLNPSSESVAASANLQILPYPQPYVPAAGTILSNSTATLPTGYLACDGTAVSRTTYNTLYNVIGTYYGQGNSTTTFNLPSLSVGTGSINNYIIRYANPELSIPSMLNVQILPYPLSYVPPPGTILRNTDPYLPNGYLACDGSAISRTEYHVLYAIIGEHYGQGDGSTTFNLPSLSNGTGASYTYIIRYIEQIIPCVTITPNLQVSGIELPLTGFSVS